MRSVAALALLGTAALYLATAGLPFFSESYSHLAAAHARTFADCFDPERIPLRPGQHVWFWVFARTGATPPVARLPGFLAHAASCVLVFRLARLLGCRPGPAAAAAAVFLAYPNVQSLVWVAAVGWPWRVLFSLAALCALLSPRGPARGALWLGGFLLALACNQGGVVLPGVGAVLVVARDGTKAWRGLARDPWFAASVVLAGAYVLYLGWLRPPAVHAPVQGAALANNLARAAVALAPADLRVPVLDLLRGERPWPGIAALAALGAGAVAWWWRAPWAVRGLLLAIPLELAPAVAVTGFVPRYAYLASAFFAVALVLAWQGTAARRARVPVATAIALLAAAWVRDTVADVGEYRRAGAAVRAVVAQARALAAGASDDATFVMVDAPTLEGAERDVPVFDWALPEALAWHGVPGRWQAVATAAPRWLRGVEHVAPGALEERLRGVRWVRYRAPAD
ncbi:MAG TPA: hypothetical protein VK081_12155 [Planctomycetota bacterium]|nr:hypothetical protein [Planctomycetota bacterium]